MLPLFRLLVLIFQLSLLKHAPALQYCEVMDKVATNIAVNSNLTYIHFPIVDGSTPTDALMIEFLTKHVIPKIKSGEKMYIHCNKGVGRTGLVTALILGIIYNLDSATALKKNNIFYNKRQLKEGETSPTTHEQKMQVHKVLSKLMAKKTQTQ